MHIERGFAHVLDCGGLRRTTLRGQANINKRYLCGILAFNLSLIMRKLTGVGTPRQAAARFWACFKALVDLLIRDDRQPDPQNPPCRAESGGAPDYQLVFEYPVRADPGSFFNRLLKHFQASILVISRDNR